MTSGIVAGITDRLLIMYAGQIVDRRPDRSGARRPTDAIHAGASAICASTGSAPTGCADPDSRLAARSPLRSGAVARSSPAARSGSTPAVCLRCSMQSLRDTTSHAGSTSGRRVRGLRRLVPTPSTWPTRRRSGAGAHRRMSGSPDSVPGDATSTQPSTRHFSPSRASTSCTPDARGALRAVDDVSFSVARGEAFSLVGESGLWEELHRTCHRPAGTHRPVACLGRQEISVLRGSALRNARRRFQMVFQDPTHPSIPRLSVRQIVRSRSPIRCHRDAHCAAEPEPGAVRLVAWTPRSSTRFPRQFSGGQRQRVGIAALSPSSPTSRVRRADQRARRFHSGADGQLLEGLQAEVEPRRIVFIAHDLAVVRAHLRSGRRDVSWARSSRPRRSTRSSRRRSIRTHKALISAAPIPNTRDQSGNADASSWKGDVPSPIDPPLWLPIPHALSVRTAAVSMSCRSSAAPRTATWSHATSTRRSKDSQRLLEPSVPTLATSAEQAGAPGPAPDTALPPVAGA